MRRALRTLAISLIAIPIGLAVSLCNADVASYVASQLAGVTYFNMTSGAFTLRGVSADGADTEVMCISAFGGQCNDGTRGAYIYMTGHEAGGDMIASASDDFFVRTGPGTSALTIDQSQLATFAGNMQFSATDAAILGKTGDAGRVLMYGGSALSSNHASLSLNGQNYSGAGGDASFGAGNVSGGDLTLFTANATSSMNLATGGFATTRFSIDGTTGDMTSNATNGGNIMFARSGKTIGIDSGTAASACKGTGTHNGTTAVTVTTTCALTGSIPFIQDTSEPTTGSGCWVTNIVNATSFDVDCKAAGQDATFSWIIVKEG